MGVVVRMPRRLIDASVMEVFWRLRGAGVSYPVAADRAGIARSTGRGALIACGGVRPRPPRPGSGRFLSFAEREEIALRLAAGLSPAVIARGLGRHRSTITGEIARHRRAHDARLDYRASRAQWRAEHNARRPKPAKLVVNAELRERVQAMLGDRWSPEQIAATLRAEFADRPEMHVSHETIYQSLYVQSRGALRRELTACLRTGRAIRRPKRRTDERRGQIPDMVMISQRPAEVEDRAVPGHWEGDLIIGRNSASAIGTLVERATRYVMLLHLPDDHGAEAVRDAMLATIATLPARMRASLTWDQGVEMSRHAEITLASDMPIYFCDPHSPWQRGTNENTNGLLRQYFPKATDLSAHSREDLDFVAHQLNTRPRKTLDWQTPAQRLNELLLQ
jgi:IS30 family transposase